MSNYFKEIAAGSHCQHCSARDYPYTAVRGLSYSIFIALPFIFFSIALYSFVLILKPKGVWEEAPYELLGGK